MIYMVITLGGLTLEVDADGIEEIHSSREVRHSILNATESKRQFLGFDSKQYRLTGIFSGTNKDADASTLRVYFENRTICAFSGYTGLTATINVRVIAPFSLNEHPTYWDFKIIVEKIA